MSKKNLLLVLIVGLIIAGIAGVFILNPAKPNLSLQSPLVIQQNPLKKIIPSNTFKEYQDPSGFAFNYPDNLSITKKDLEESDYANIELSSKEVNGSLNLRISDSKFKSLDDWLKQNQGSAKNNPKELKLGELKALELQHDDRLLLGALDKGVLFSIEMPLVEKDFWMVVYNKLLADFSFASAQTSEGDSAQEITFEGEEVVE